jgi:hypothetical protein
MFSGGGRPASGDDKMKALKQYRRARGLCERCAEKWSYGHRCAPTVQLHAIQECWDLFADEESSEGSMESLQQSKESGQLCLFLSEAAVSGADSPKSMRMWGSIQGQDVLLLVDSGSSHSFMSSKIAAPRLKVLYCCTLCQW